MTLAIFDLDNTLIAGDSDYAWGEFMIEKKLVNAASYQLANDKFYSDYQHGTLDIYAYQEFVLAPLTEFSFNELHELHREFMQSKIIPLILPKAQALIAHHRALKHILLIITATNRFVTEPIAKKLSIDNLLATEPEIIDTRFTGKLCDIPCFQQGKVERLNKWVELNHLSLKGSYFYSDSANDIPLLNYVDNPIAVDPDTKLKSIALENNWPIISLR